MTETISKGGVVQLNIPRHLTARISIMEFKSASNFPKTNNYSHLLLQVSPYKTCGHCRVKNTVNLRVVDWSAIQF